MRVGVVDVGTNSTRLLIADVDAEGVREVVRHTRVTRLGEGVDGAGRLSPEAMERVHAAIADYRADLDAHRPDRAIAVLTSAVRDAANGPEFTREVARRHGLDARTITGEEEAALTFRGATADWDGAEPVVVIDVGGGSTELVAGPARRPEFSVSTQAGVVRQTERHIAHDPPRPEEVEAVAAEVRELFAEAVPERVRRTARAAIAVAGTPTSLAAIDLQAEPYNPARVHGHVLPAATIEHLLARLAAVDLAERRRIPGLHPDRAPTIVADAVILREALRAFGLDSAVASEHDLLRGAASAVAQDAE